ncbi:MAG: hypothetical protein H7255_15945 [Ramlibacter sp.]|nr:hypothetical protein [Ramlibacter sp.]
MFFTRRIVCISAAAVFFPATYATEFKVAGESAQDVFGGTPLANLALAAAGGRIETVKKLVSEAVNVNSVGKRNMTALVWALTARNPAGMRALLEAGADPNQSVGPEQDFHPVWLAAGQDTPDQLAVLLDFKGDPNAPHKGADYVPLMRAKTKLRNVQLLVKAGANINAANSIGGPVVLSAANIAQYDIVMFALEHGFNQNLPLLVWEINDRRPNGRAPLPPELEPKRVRVMEMLRRMGISPPSGRAPALNRPAG